jgi:tRNA nucleotidyltransferase (CCA-adding enzyme)
MRLTTIPTEFLQAVPVIAEIEQAGFEAYFVGGSVRDALLGHKKIHDVDIATSAYPAEIKQIFRRTVDTGIQHGTVTVLQGDLSYEVTTFRTESGYQDFRRPDHVTFVRSLAEDLKRRDFTINALALQHDGTVIDLFDGLTDLKQRVIRAVGTPATRFHEDALRMMRAIRFQSQLDFTIEPATLAAIQTEHHLLAKIAVERIHDEFTKLLLGQRRQNALQNFVTTRLFEDCPGMATSEQALLALSQLPNQPLHSAASAWTLMAYGLGWTPQQAVKQLKRWKSPNQLIATVSKNLGLIPHFIANDLTNWDLYQAGWDCLTITNEVMGLYQKALPEAQLQQQYQQLPIKTKSELALNGRDLLQQTTIKPGPQMGRILNQLEQAVVAGKLVNDAPTLLTQAEQMMA